MTIGLYTVAQPRYILFFFNYLGTMQAPSETLGIYAHDYIIK